jgi:hypothetical protein
MVSAATETASSTSVTEAWQILADIHEEVRKDASKMHDNACSKASLFLAKVLLGADRGNYGKVLEVYAGTQREWFEKWGSVVIQPTFFTEWISWSTEARKMQEKQGKKK